MGTNALEQYCREGFLEKDVVEKVELVEGLQRDPEEDSDDDEDDS